MGLIGIKEEKTPPLRDLYTLQASSSTSASRDISEQLNAFRESAARKAFPALILLPVTNLSPARAKIDRRGKKSKQPSACSAIRNKDRRMEGLRDATNVD